MFTLQTNKESGLRGGARGVSVPDLIPIMARNNVSSRYPKVKAQGKLTLSVNPADGDTITVGTKTYTLQTTLTNVDGNIKIGGTVSDTQSNIVAAINLAGQPGTQYALATRVNEVITIADFSANEAIITSVIAGTTGNSIATTETFTSGSNLFDAATLGTYRAGADYTYPDITYSPWISPTGTNGSGFAKPAFDPGQIYLDYTGAGFPQINKFWPASSFTKITIPDSYANKIKRVNSLGMCIANKVNQILTTTTGHANNNVYKIIEIGTNKGLVQYLDGTASQVYLMAFTIDANGVITSGTPVTMNSMNNIEAYCDVVKIDTDKILVSYRDTGATNYPKCAVGSISGTTITMSAGVQPVATATTESKLIQLGTDKALLAFNGVDLYVVSIASTTPSYGAVQAVSGATYMSMVQNGTDKAQIAYRKSSACFTRALTVSTVTITLGTELQVTSSDQATDWNRHPLVKLDTDKIGYFIQEVDSAIGQSCDMFFLTVSGTITTIASASYSGYGQSANMYAILFDTNKILIVKGTANGMIIDVDLTNNRLTSRLSIEAYDTFTDSGNNRGNGTGYIGDGNVRLAKIGSFVLAFSKQPSPNNKIQTFVFPISLSIDVYLDDDYVKTVTYDRPFCYAPLVLDLEVDGFGAAIKLKNPNAVEMLIYPENEGYCGSMVLE